MGERRADEDGVDRHAGVVDAAVMLSEYQQDDGAWAELPRRRDEAASGRSLRGARTNARPSQLGRGRNAPIYSTQTRRPRTFKLSASGQVEGVAADADRRRRATTPLLALAR